LIDKLLNGVGQPIYSAVAQTNIMYSSQTPKYEFSIDKAKATLTTAGYKIEGGKLKDKAGKEIPKLKFLYQTGSPIGEGVAVVSQQNWKELGIEMELVPLEFQAFVNQIKKEPFDYDLFGGAWSSTADVETFDQVWKAIPSLNAGAWDTAIAKQVIELHKKARQEFDFAKRKELMAQVQTLTAQDLPYIFLWQQKSLAAVSSKVIISPLLNNGIAYNYRSDWSLK